MYDKISGQLEFQHKALNLLVKRQEMIASNIANADTPHFKARDIDFKSALADRLANRRGAGEALVRTHRTHLGATGEAGGAASVKYRNEFQAGVDGNTVNMDIERAAFADTSLRVEAALTFIRGSLKGLETALSQ